MVERAAAATDDGSAGSVGHPTQFSKRCISMRTTRALEPEVAISPPESEPATQNIFPLRLTPFEYYYLLEDRPDYPSVFYVRLECRGALDREAFERAFRFAHTRHPLLSAGLERDRDGWPIWVVGQPDPIQWDHHTVAARETFLGATVAPRLQASVTQEGERSTLTFAFHHVAVDGMGGFQFIADLMTAYAHDCTSAPGVLKFPALDQRLLKTRNDHTLFQRGFRLIDLVRFPRVALPLLLQRVARLRGDVQEVAAGSGPQLPSDFLIHTLTEQQTATLARVARKLSVRLHELLLRDYFLMLAAWNEGSSEARWPIRVLVPTNLRRRQHHRMSAANLFGYTFLTRRGKHCQNRNQLLDSIRSETSAIKSTGRAMYHEAHLYVGCIWPPLLRSSLERKSPFATAVFTNLNASFNHVPLPLRDGRRVAGDLIVENGYGAGPIRPDTRVSLAIHNYAGRMTLAFRCDQYVFGQDQQQAIVQAYLDQLDTTAQCES
jgi:NRPS condensation-like uncharacterized protein